MDTYEKEMYDFLTQRDNFENMVKVLGMKDMIRENLVVDFWDAVYEKLVELNKANNIWEVKKPKTNQGYFQGEDSSVFLYKKSWMVNEKDSPVVIGWASLANKMFYGIWVYYDKSHFDNQRVIEAVRPKAYEKKFESNDIWPLSSKTYDYNFMEFNQLDHILPDRREALAKEFAKTLFHLAEEFESILDTDNKIHEHHSTQA